MQKVKSFFRTVSIVVVLIGFLVVLAGSAVSSGPEYKQGHKVLVLHKYNTLILRGPVTSESIAVLQQEATAKASHLSSSDTIYFVLDTPGGEVEAGLDLLDTLHALAPNIDTVTLFSASMGFHFVQNLGKRYITPSGTLMSHRMAVQGVQGQLPGNLITRINNILRLARKLDIIAAGRMLISIDQYRAMIADEYWAQGEEAVEQHSADEVVYIKCGRDLSGTVKQLGATPFGYTEMTYSACPLIRNPLKIGE